MVILGLNGGLRLGYQDTSAVLICDGKVTSAIEEERLNRIKHSFGQLPELAIAYVLKKANLEMTNVDTIAFHGSTWGDEFTEVLEDYIRFRFGHCPPIQRVHHHDAHAASAYFSSGFDESMILTMDSSGDGASTQLMVGRNGELEPIERIERPQSLGLFYSTMTQWCGFTRDRDEYKLMGLSAYGDPDGINLDWLFSSDNQSGYSLDLSYLHGIAPGQPQRTRQQPIFNNNLTERLGPARTLGAPITDLHRNVAAAAQKLLEKAVVDTVTRLHQKTGIRRICLAGGVALNCLANQKVMNLNFIDEIFVQPASSDAGISLGAAQLVSQQLGAKPQPIDHCYWGREYSDQEIEADLRLLGVAYKKVTDPSSEAAQRIADNQVIGWFQGGSEFGPRALGHRSILANPKNENIKRIINEKVKFREGFRPFCPSVLQEDLSEHFEGQAERSPYMNITYRVRQDSQSQLGGVTHVDGTARVQSVSSEANPLFYQLLLQLKEKTGVGVCLNTSFNLSHEPIVENPKQALASFFGCGLDALVIGSFVVDKENS